MSYEYTAERSKLFTDEGQKMFLKVRDRVHKLLDEVGAVRAQEALSGMTGDTWMHIACLDRLIELGEIVEVAYAATPWAQYHVFVSNRHT